MTSTRPFGRRNRTSTVPSKAGPRPARLSATVPDPQIDRRSSRRLFFDWLRYAGYGALVVAGLAGLRSINEGPSGQTTAAVANVAKEHCGASLSEFYDLRPGMTYSEVRKVIGCEGEVISQVELAGVNTVMVGWDGVGSFGANMHVMFQDNRMITRAQFGLE
jgi:hypothetical protein